MWFKEIRESICFIQKININSYKYKRLDPVAVIERSRKKIVQPTVHINRTL